jgi:hypothetical protein
LIGFEKVFSSTKDAAFRAAVRRLEKEITKLPVRQQLFQAAGRGQQYLNGFGNPQATAMAEQLALLMQRLEALGV